MSGQLYGSNDAGGVDRCERQQVIDGPLDPEQLKRLIQQAQQRRAGAIAQLDNLLRGVLSNGAVSGLADYMIDSAVQEILCLIVLQRAYDIRYLEQHGTGAFCAWVHRVAGRWVARERRFRNRWQPVPTQRDRADEPPSVLERLPAQRPLPDDEAVEALEPNRAPSRTETLAAQLAAINDYVRRYLAATPTCIDWYALYMLFLRFQTLQALLRSGEAADAACERAASWVPWDPGVEERRICPEMPSLRETWNQIRRSCGGDRRVTARWLLRVMTTLMRQRGGQLPSEDRWYQWIRRLRARLDELCLPEPLQRNTDAVKLWRWLVFGEQFAAAHG